MVWRSFIVKVCEQFLRREFFTVIASTQSLEKIKNCRRSRKNLSAVFDKVCVPFFTQRLIRLFSAATKQIGEKLVSKFATKLSKKFNSAIKKFRLAISGSCSFAPGKCACHQRFAATRSGGKASSVRSAKIKFYT